MLLIGQVNHEQVAAATQETLNEVIWLLDRLKAMSGCSDEHLAGTSSSGLSPIPPTQMMTHSNGLQKGA